MKPSYTLEYKQYCAYAAVDEVFRLTGVLTDVSQFASMSSKLKSTGTCSYEGFRRNEPAYIVWKETPDTKVTYFYRDEVPDRMKNAPSTTITCKALPSDRFDELFKIASGETTLPSVAEWNSMVDQYNDLRSIKDSKEKLELELHIINRLSDGTFCNTREEIAEYAKQLANT